MSSSSRAAWRALLTLALGGLARTGCRTGAADATPVVAPDLGIHPQQRARPACAMQPAVTWIGHATLLLQIGGLNVLTDPIFSERASPLAFSGPRRHVAPGIALAATAAASTPC